MKNIRFSNQKITYYVVCISLYALGLIVSDLAIAADIPGVLSGRDLGSILTNIRRIFPEITTLILAVCFVSGIWFIFNAVRLMRTFGQQQQMMQRESSFSGPILNLVVGTALIYMPATTKVFSNSIFGSFANNIFGDLSGDAANMIVISGPVGSTGLNTDLSVQNRITYDETGGQSLLNYIAVDRTDNWVDLMNTLVMFIQMVGFVAFVRGWFIISHSIGQGAQQGTFSKGLIHLIGGIIAINFIPFMQTIADLVF